MRKCGCRQHRGSEEHDREEQRGPEVGRLGLANPAAHRGLTQQPGDGRVPGVEGQRQQFGQVRHIPHPEHHRRQVQASIAESAFRLLRNYQSS